MKASVIYHAIWKAKSDAGTPTKYMHAIGPHRGWTPHAHNDSKEPNYKLARAQSTTWEILLCCFLFRWSASAKKKKLKNVRHALKTCVKFQRHLNLSLNWVAKRLASHYFREQRPQFGWHNLCAAYEKFIASFAMLISMSHWPVLRVNMTNFLHELYSTRAIDVDTLHISLKKCMMWTLGLMQSCVYVCVWFKTLIR